MQTTRQYRNFEQIAHHHAAGKPGHQYGHLSCYDTKAGDEGHQRWTTIHIHRRKPGTNPGPDADQEKTL